MLKLFFQNIDYRYDSKLLNSRISELLNIYCNYDLRFLELVYRICI